MSAALATYAAENSDNFRSELISYLTSRCLDVSLPRSPARPYAGCKMVSSVDKPVSLLTTILLCMVKGLKVHSRGC